MNLLRKHKLQKLGIPPGEKYLEVLDFVNFKLSKVQKFEMVEYPNLVFYMKSGMLFLQYDKTSKIFSIRYRDFVDTLMTVYKIPYDYIKDFFREIFSEIYSLTIDEINLSWSVPSHKVETTYEVRKRLYSIP